MLEFIRKISEKKNNVSEKYSSISSMLYLAGLSMYLVSNYLRGTMFLSHTDKGKIIFLILFVGVLFVGAKILIFDNWLNKSYVIALLLVILFYSIGKQSGDYDIMYYTVFIVGAINIDFKTILKVFLTVITVLLLITVILSLTGIIRNVVVYRSDNPSIRYALGALYPTDFAARVFYLMLAYVTMRGFKLIIPEWISLVAITTTMYVVTDTRLDLLLMLLFLVSVAGKKCILDALNKIKINAINICIILMICIYIIMSYMYNPHNTILNKLNSVLSNRLFYGHKVFRDYNIEWLGQYINQNGLGGGATPKDYFYIDSSYLRILMMQGIVAFVIFIIAIVYANYKFYKSNVKIMIIIYLFVILSSAIDQHFFEISFNIFLLSLSADLSSYNNKVNEVRC